MLVKILEFIGNKLKNILNKKVMEGVVCRIFESLKKFLGGSDQGSDKALRKQVRKHSKILEKAGRKKLRE